MPFPSIEWTDDNNTVQTLAVMDQIFIGRALKGIDETRGIIIKNPAVSREHATISYRGAVLEIMDISTNGTWVNNVRMAPGSRITLKDGDVVKIAHKDLKIIHAAAKEPEVQEDWAQATNITSTQVVVTNLIADVRGFSRLSQVYGHENTYAVIKEVFDTFSRIVTENMGTVKDYAGDAVFAFWMHQGKRDKIKAVHACRAAIHQANSVEHIKRKLTPSNPAAAELQMGWGLGTGTVTMSHYGARVSDIAIVGDCANLASRLSDMAVKTLDAKIVMCSKTAALVQKEIPIYDLGFVNTKGRKGKEQVFGITL